jgi:hypothetical protein
VHRWRACNDAAIQVQPAPTSEVKARAGSIRDLLVSAQRKSGCVWLCVVVCGCLCLVAGLCLALCEQPGVPCVRMSALAHM